MASESLESIVLRTYSELGALASAWVSLAHRYPESTWSAWADLVAGNSTALLVRSVTYTDPATSRRVLLLAPPCVSMTSRSAFRHSDVGYAAIASFLEDISHVLADVLGAGGSVRWAWQLPFVPSVHHAKAMTEHQFVAMRPSIRNGEGPMKHIDTGMPLQYFEIDPTRTDSAPGIEQMARCADGAWDVAMRVSSRSFALSLRDIDIMRDTKTHEVAWLYDPQKMVLSEMRGQRQVVGRDFVGVVVPFPLPPRTVFVHTHPELCSFPKNLGELEDGGAFTYNLVPSIQDNAAFVVAYMMDPRETLPATLVVAPEGVYAVTVHPGAQRVIRAAHAAGGSFASVPSAVRSLARAISALVTSKNGYSLLALASPGSSGGHEMEHETERETLDNIRRHLGPVLDNLGSEHVPCGKDALVHAQLQRLPGVSAMMYISTYFDGNEVAAALALAPTPPPDAYLTSAMRAIGDGKVLCIELHRHSLARKRSGIVVRYSSPSPAPA